MAAGVQSESTSPPIGVRTALRGHWVVALIVVLVFVGSAAAAGLKRSPRYTARAHMVVSLGDVSNPAGLGSAVQGTTSLAAVYSRVIESNEIEEETTRSLGERAPSSFEISASPVPESPLINVTAVADSEREAVALVNAASTALVDYSDRRADADGAAEKRLERYHKAALRQRELLNVRDRRAKQHEAKRSRANRAALERANAAVDTAQLRRDALLSAYNDAVKGVDSSPRVEFVERATAAQTDRYRTLQILVFAGLLAGAGAGVALALLLAHRGAFRDAH